MKTAITTQMTTEQKILEVLNPVRLYTVEDWMKVAEVIILNVLKTPGEKNDEYFRQVKLSIPMKGFSLISRFEELTRGKWEYVPEVLSDDGSDLNKVEKVWQPALLKKEHFVCEVQEPKFEELGDQLYDAYEEHYQAAQAKLFFEGFKALPPIAIGYDVYTDDLGLNFYKHNNGDTLVQLYLAGKRIIELTTLFDFIYHVDFYNSTAKEPIKLFWKENFINQLIK